MRGIRVIVNEGLHFLFLVMLFAKLFYRCKHVLTSLFVYLTFYYKMQSMYILLRQQSEKLWSIDH